MKESTILVCNSNMFVPYVLSEVLENQDKHYLVISDTLNIHKLFHSFQIPNIDYLEYTYSTKMSFLYRRFEICKKIRKYKINKIVFYHAECGNLANYLIKKLAQKKVPVEYHKLFDAIPVPQAKGLKSIKIFLMQYLFYGIKMDVLDNGQKIFESLPDRFFEEVNAKVITARYNAEIVSEFVRKNLSDKKINKQIVLLTGTIVKTGFVTEQNFTRVINSIIETIGNNNICKKCHPRFTDEFGLEKNLPEIPSYIPGNLLINAYDVFVGYHSTLLVEAAQQGKLVISYLDLMEPQSETARENLHTYLENRLAGKGVIHYPKTMEELKALLKS